jgi:hypothetical protein
MYASSALLLTFPHPSLSKTTDDATTKEPATVTATTGEYTLPHELFPSDGIDPLTFASPFINTSVTADVPDNDNDNDDDNTIANFEGLIKKDSHMVVNK